MSISFDSNDLFYIESNLIGERVSLFDLAVWKNGLAFKNIDFSTTGKPVIKIAELNNGISNNTAYTDKEYSDEVALRYGDLVFSWSGNPQTSIDIYKYTLPDGWLNQHIFKVTPESKVDKDFLFYVMKYLKPNFTKIATNKQTTGLGHVTLSDIKRISLILPNPYVQKQISAILSSIDNKIELNQLQNNNLEQQAQALFKSWFVDFEPFGGKMPDDWKVGKLGEITEITMGQSPNGSSYNEEKNGCIFFQGRAEFGTRFPKVRLYTTEPKRMAKKGDVLVSVRAPVGDFNVAIDNCCIGRGLCAIRSKQNCQSFILYTIWASQDKLNIFNGEGTVFGSVNKDSLYNMPVVIPTNKIMQKFEYTCSALDKLIWNNSLENTRLAQLRDTLLPKLMSGEIDVSKVNISADKLSFIIIDMLYFYNKNFLEIVDKVSLNISIQSSGHRGIIFSMCISRKIYINLQCFLLEYFFHFHLSGSYQNILPQNPFHKSTILKFLYHCK